MKRNFKILEYISQKVFQAKEDGNLTPSYVFLVY